MSTQVTESYGKTSAQLYPSISTGIFKIMSAGQNLKYFCITNNEGRIIHSSAKDFSEVDLTDFPSGMYFYSITDDKENVFRGRIVKE
jgi:hypothetical protein